MPFSGVEHALIVAAIVVAGSVAALAWRNRSAPGAVPLTIFMVSFVVWNLAHVFSHLSPPGIQTFVDRFRWIGIAPSAFLWLAFSLSFVRRRARLSRGTWALLLAWPTALLVGIWLPPVAGAVGVESVSAVYPGLADETGLAYWTHVGLSYLALGAGTALFGGFVYRTRAVFRRQGLAVIAGVVVVWAASLISVLDLFDSVHFLALPLGFVCSGGLFLWAITGAELTDLAPVATSTVVERMDGAVVVVDCEGRIVKTNPTAADLFDFSTDRPVVGEPLESVIDVDLSASVEPADTGTDGGDTDLVSVGDRIVRVKPSRLTDGRGTPIGRVFLCSDVTERHRRQVALERKNDRLDAFASVVSHDLRNPLAVANTNLRLARETGELDRLSDAEAALGRMDRLVDDLLALAREGEAIEDPHPVTLGDVARTNWTYVETPGATLSVDADLTFEADRNQLGRLLENLFRNSIEHAATEPPVEDTPPVTVTVGTLEDSDGSPPTGFFVADDGPGIAPEDRDVVFQPGYSGGGGTGLGLAIVDQVAEAHGWTVDVAESEDGGARFEFRGVEVPPEDGSSTDRTLSGLEGSAVDRKDSGWGATLDDLDDRTG